jgi:uncharacterized protein YerC
MLAKRLAVAAYLKKGRSYDAIKTELKVSSATVAAVQTLLEKNTEGLNLALKLLEADQWAEALINKLSAKIASWRKSFT